MNKKSKSLFIIFSLLFVLGVGELIYLNEAKSMSSVDLDKKKRFVELVGLPDLAFSSEANYIRHRSLSNVFSIYSEDGSLREHSYVSFSTTSTQAKGTHE